MKKSILLSLLALLITLVSCTKNENNYYIVENVTVQFEAKELITKVETAFQKRASISGDRSIPSSPFVHVIPSTYKAHFIATESRGQYSENQLIKTIDVTEGSHTITIPKLKYRVIVTSYTGFSDNELKYQDVLSVLPKSSDEIHLLGQNNIDYINNTSGTVEVKNPYAAVMISNNQWVNGAPRYDSDSKDFSLVDNDNWYLLYIKPESGQTQIRVPVPLNQTYYTIEDNFNPNTIYEYTFNGVGDVNGNFTVNTEEIFKVVEKKIIDLY